MKKILSILLGIMLCFSFCGCEISFNNGSGTMNNLTQLSEPMNVEVFDDYIYWNEVSNASSYVVKINNIQENVGNALKYSIASIMDNRIDSNVPTELHIYVKAKGNQILYSDSNWSNEYVYTYTKKNNNNDNNSSNNGETVQAEKLVSKAAINKAKELRIGYAYNFVDDVYFDVTHASQNSVLDLEKLFINSSLSAQASTYTKTNKIYEETITEFYKEVSDSMASEISVEGGHSIYSANVSVGLKSSSTIEFGEYAKSGFLNCYSYSEYKNYQVLDFGTTLDLSHMFSANFLDMINKKGSYVSFTDEEIAEHIIRNYGTHLIMGVKTGGRLDYYYSFATNNHSAASDFKQEVTTSASVGIAGLISASTSNSISSELAESISNNETKTSSSFEIYGGNTEGISENNIAEKFVSWSSSINESNARSIGVAKNGIIYLPTLISYLNEDLGNLVDSFINKKAEQAYNELVSRFASRDLDSNGSGTISNPYKIGTATQLFQYLNSSEADTHYTLINDIDLTGYQWTPIENFKGVLDGDGYTIKNLSIERIGLLRGDSVYTGFVQINEGIIENLSFDNVNVKTTYLYSDTAKRNFYSGLIGLNYGKIGNIQVRNSKFDIAIALEDKISGEKVYPNLELGTIVGSNCGEIEICKVDDIILESCLNGGANLGTISSSVGGLVGTNQGDISNSISSRISMASKVIGGDSQFVLFATLKSNIGYITGSNKGDIKNCVSYSHAPNSLYSEVTALVDRTLIVNNIGLASGENSGVFDNVYVLAVENIERFIGSNPDSYNENIKTDISQIVSIVGLWEYWSYEDGELKLTV